ncbi:hypothetical protein ACOSQ3_029998 [Xanthoceras sorbifolium]
MTAALSFKGGTVVVVAKVKALLAGSRAFNFVVHGIAIWALSFSSLTVWTNVFPSWLVDLAAGDLVRGFSFG